MNPYTEIDSKKLKKAHKAGSKEVKKVLEELAPELFKINYPIIGEYPNGEIVLFVEDGVGISLSKSSEFFGFESGKVLRMHGLLC